MVRIHAQIVGIITVFAMLGLSGCQQSDALNPTGLFVGTGFVATQATSEDPVVHQLMARSSGFRSKFSKKEFLLELYSILGSAQPRHFSVEVGKSIGNSKDREQNLTINTDFLNLSAEPLKFSFDFKMKQFSEGQCVFNDEVVSITHPQYCLSQLCVSNKKIDFEISECSTRQVVGSLHLEKNASLDNPPSKREENRIYSLDEVVGRAKFLNYTIQQEAEKVFQARESLKIAQSNLLPHIQIRNIFSFVLMDPAGVVESLGNLLPFLFPSNWYQWEGAKSLLQAQRKSFASLRGNEMQAAETLFYLTQRDEELLRLVDSHIAWIEKIEQNILTEEQVGILPHGSAEYFGTRVLSMKQDREQIQRLLSVERAALSQAIGLPALNGVSRTISFSEKDLSQMPPVVAASMSDIAKKKSLEVEVLDALALASDSAKDVATYGFLNPSIESTFGFTTSHQIKVGESQRREIEKKKEEVLALVEQRVLEIHAEYDAAVRSYVFSKESVFREQNRFNWVMTRHLSGDSSLTDEEFLVQIGDLQQKILFARANQISSVTAYDLAQSKRSRLLREGFYEDLEALLPMALPTSISTP